MSASLVAAWATGVMWLDWRERRVPNGMILLGASGAAGVMFWTGAGYGGASWESSVACALMLAGGLIACFARGWIGGGDVKFLSLLPLLVGPTVTLAAMLLGSLLAGIWAGVLAMTRGRAQCAPTVPLTVPYGAALVLVLARVI